MKKAAFVLLSLLLVIGCNRDWPIESLESSLITPAAPLGFYIEDDTTENDLMEFEENEIASIRAITYTKEDTINDSIQLIIIRFDSEDDVQKYQQKYDEAWETENINGQEVKVQRLAGLKTQLTIRWQTGSNIFHATGFTDNEKEIYDIAMRMITENM